MRQISPYIFSMGRDASLHVTAGPVVSDWCEAEVSSAPLVARTFAVLDELTPQRVLWAEIATPLGAPMPSILAER
jgi:hypothetical protein